MVSMRVPGKGQKDIRVEDRPLTRIWLSDRPIFDAAWSLVDDEHRTPTRVIIHPEVFEELIDEALETEDDDNLWFLKKKLLCYVPESTVVLLIIYEGGE